MFYRVEALLIVDTRNRRFVSFGEAKILRYLLASAENFSGCIKEYLFDQVIKSILFIKENGHQNYSIIETEITTSVLIE